MISNAPADTYVTTSFRTLGYAGAILFTLAPAAFAYEMYLLLYTTAVEDNPMIGPFASLALLLACASIPMMIIGRRTRHSSQASLGNDGRRS